MIAYADQHLVGDWAMAAVCSRPGEMHTQRSPDVEKDMFNIIADNGLGGVLVFGWQQGKRGAYKGRPDGPGDEFGAAYDMW
jgi:hypothetical protein